MESNTLEKANFLSRKISELQYSLKKIEEYKKVEDKFTYPYNYFSIDLELIEPMLDKINTFLEEKRREYANQLSNL